MLIGPLTLLALAVTHVKPGVPVWQHQSGQTLTQVQLLPQNSWGFGTTPMNMTPAPPGSPINGGTTTKFGCFVAYRYNLRVWDYDPKTGLITYDMN